MVKFILMEKGVCTTESSEVVFQSERTTVMRDQVKWHNSFSKPYEYISRRPFVIVAPREDSYFYLVEQYRYPVSLRSIEFPKGVLEPDELPEEGAARELREEAGLKAAKITSLGCCLTSPGLLNQRFYPFLSEDHTLVGQQLEATEADMTVRKMSLAEIIKAISSGQIIDSPTITTMGLYLCRYGNIHA